MRSNCCRRSAILVILLLGMTAAISCASDPDIKEGAKADEIVAKIRAEWDKNRQRIRSIECSGKRESTHLKGAYTRDLAAMKIKDPPICPDKDLVYSDEPFRWTIDFEQSRIRRDIEFTEPFFTQGSTSVPFKKKRDVDIVANGEYRCFHPVSIDSPAKGSDWSVRICPKVLRFMSFDALPLLWLAGGVSASVPGPDTLNVYADTSKWNVKGSAQLNGKDCYVVAMPEQQTGGTMVREFWILAQKPYPVVSCLVRSQRGIPWKLDATYSQRDGELTLSTVKYVEYQYPSSKVAFEWMSKFEEFYINRTIDDHIFEKTLEPGMSVTFQGKKEK